MDATRAARSLTQTVDAALRGGATSAMSADARRSTPLRSASRLSRPASVAKQTSVFDEKYVLLQMVIHRVGSRMCTKI